ncbi:MAG: sodium-dependent transporter [Tissierellia bacterium]|nr:sodium-dependent transporter [Tissierellia bacterium]
MNRERETWGSRIGFVLAAAGSAVGLGNIWRFPYITGENGGGAFLLIYIFFTFVVGVSIMTAEFILGRNSKLSSVGAFKSKNRSWTFVGALSVLAPFLIMGYYPVIGGWSLAYTVKSLTGLLASPDIEGTFVNLITGTWEPLIWMLIYLSFNVFIILRGVTKGIEKASVILMPTLFVLLLIIIVKGLTLPGASEGLKFLLKPDFSQVRPSSFLVALGQAFFSLSLAMGVMTTYASYLGKEESLPQNALIISTMDFTVALMAGLALFPALFAFGMEPSQGPGLVFMVVPKIFAAMGGVGPIFSFIFFAALMVAALTSSMSLLEVVVSYLMDERGMERRKATLLSAGAMSVVCIFASLSQGPMANFTIFGVGTLDFLDLVTDKIFLAVGGLFISIFVGWKLDKEMLFNEFTNHGKSAVGIFPLWYNLIKYVIPVMVTAVAVSGILSIKQTGVMLTGVAIIALLAIFSKKL